MIYLDYAATTPPRQETLLAYTEAAHKCWGNTQSLHDVGTNAHDLFQSCRQMIASLIGARQEGIYFTGNASEANQLGIRSVLRGRPMHLKEIVTIKMEHASVLNTMNELEKEGYFIHYLPVDEKGIVSVEQYKKIVNRETALVVIQYVNSEMGAIQPIQTLANWAKSVGVPFHCDAVQALGKLPIHVEEMNVTSAVFSAHKCFGPKGVGVAYVDPSVHWQALYEGTTHQSSFRAGTVDVPSIAAATIACKLAVEEQETSYMHAKRIEQYIEERMSTLEYPLQLTGKKEERSPFIYGFLLPNIEGQWMMLECNREQIAISTGTACKIGFGEAASAMAAIGYEADDTRRFIRISIHKQTTTSEIDEFFAVLSRSLQTSSIDRLALEACENI
ncbi:IscS subfamily cysteine desulfurase [Lederbergia lenta]|uniref:Cysteine desulfurase n=1 Tax=Lederbergia lenta TaxID=1467 RepID=A0A2X4WLR0_LEDLE|nr:IscS subfamily cysteine desulfurase [Lederbergia lenta]MEC2324711.1 IscS subfamily cysteine desulfurase [Lederbergia lenta]SQI58500.1 cysteine desulfurase [Lederbergia lenta]